MVRDKDVGTEIPAPTNEIIEPPTASTKHMDTNIPIATKQTKGPSLMDETKECSKDLETTRIDSLSDSLKFHFVIMPPLLEPC